MTIKELEKMSKGELINHALRLQRILNKYAKALKESWLNEK